MKPLIPEAALSQHIAVFGKTGSGKTFATKAALVEPALAAGRRVAIVDPTAAWWGLRSSRDGKGPGFPILVLGGDHGALPLPALGGAAVARLIAEQGVSLVAETSLFTVGERTGYKSSGPVSSAFAHLVALDYAKQAGRGHLVAAGEFFA